MSDFETTMIFSEDVSRHQQHDRALKLTIACHPDRNRIGAHATVATRHHNGDYRDTSVHVGRNEPQFSDGEGIGVIGRRYGVSREGNVTISIAGKRFSFRSISDRAASLFLCPQGGAGEIAHLERGVVFQLVPGIVLILREVLGLDDTPSDHPAYREMGFRFPCASAEGRSIQKQLYNALETDDPLLLVGENGVGKHHAARAVALASQRGSNKVVEFIAGSIQSEHRQEQLFGRVYGEGFFGQAAAVPCPIICEDIDQAGAEVQQTLAQALSGQILPLHENAYVHDCRVIATAYRSLDEQRADRKLRSRFYDVITIPPLRDRPEDIAYSLHLELSENDSAFDAPEPWDALLPSGIDGEPETENAWSERRKSDAFWATRFIEMITGRRYVDNYDELKRVILNPSLTNTPQQPDNREQSSITPPVAAGVGVDSLTDDEIYELGKAFGWEWKSVADHLGVVRSTFYERLKRHSYYKVSTSLTLAEIEEALAVSDRNFDKAASLLEVSRRQLKSRYTALSKK